ncbi:hypothetical protein DFH09DRAFT_1087864 [Mycena vulgaris]|nr:hypothetical protein DFH09DRAFT_1087864 [Mycena vulgaris]
MSVSAYSTMIVRGSQLPRNTLHRFVELFQSSFHLLDPINRLGVQQARLEVLEKRREVLDFVKETAVFLGCIAGILDNVDTRLGDRNELENAGNESDERDWVRYGGQRQGPLTANSMGARSEFPASSLVTVGDPHSKAGKSVLESVRGSMVDSLEVRIFAKKMSFEDVTTVLEAHNCQSSDPMRTISVSFRISLCPITHTAHNCQSLDPMRTPSVSFHISLCLYPQGEWLAAGQLKKILKPSGSGPVTDAVGRYFGSKMANKAVTPESGTVSYTSKELERLNLLSMRTAFGGCQMYWVLEPMSGMAHLNRIPEAAII